MPIPLVGQPASVLMWYPTALIGCKCGGAAGVKLIVVTGLNNTSVCGVCGKMYRILQVNPDGTLAIDTLIPMAGSDQKM